MIFKDMYLRHLVKKENKDYLDYVCHGCFKGTVYGVDVTTGEYTFWRYSKGRLHVIEDNISKSKAKFMLLVLMGGGDVND